MEEITIELNPYRYLESQPKYRVRKGDITASCNTMKEAYALIPEMEHVWVNHNGCLFDDRRL